MREDIQKQCSRCGQVKCLDKFHKSPKHLFGHHSVCSECRKDDGKRWNEINKEKKRKQSHDRYLKKVSEMEVKPVKRRKGLDIDRNRATKRRLYESNKERYRELIKKWAKDHPDRVREIKRRFVSKHKRTTQEKLNDCMRNGMNKSLKNGSKSNRSWEKLVGYTVLELMKHIEKQFIGDMSWENHGDVWHIDHIIPISAFNYETPEDIDFKKCWSMKNLRPLDSMENLIKNGKVQRPFQPSLTI